MKSDWDRKFLRLFRQCLGRLHSGDTAWETYFHAHDLAFLASIGHKPRELFDYVEDFADGGDPTPETALLIAAVRRDYFLHMQKGFPSQEEVLPSDLPDKSMEMDGIAWLPRIIAKARGKLRGELDPDIMFGCGGDRAFLESHDIHPADFLRVVWGARDDDSAILAFVKSGPVSHP